MYCGNLLYRLCDIAEKLQDEESKIIFEARINYLFTRDEDEYYKVIEKITKKSICMELEDFLKDNEGNHGIIIYDAGVEGIRTKKLLDACNQGARMFCDDDKDIIGKKVEGLEVISSSQLVEDYSDCVVILSKRESLADMYSRLLRSGFPRKQILFPMYMHLVGSNGRQYFDVLEPIEDEIYIDAGAYNGDTIRDFIDWTKGNYKKIYAFEPSRDMVQILKAHFEKEQIDNLVFMPKATWCCEEEIKFIEDASASRIGKEGEVSIQAIDIDSVVGDDIVTFIKMDVEGSELQSLMGAQNTIKLNKPRLAISVYHKPEDVVEISEYILKLNPEYKLLLRQYNSNFWETVLYAF